MQYNTTHHIALNLLSLLFFSLSFIYFSLTFYFSRIDSQGSYRRIYPPLEGEDPFRSFLDSQPPVFADTVTSKVYIYICSKSYETRCTLTKKFALRLLFWQARLASALALREELRSKAEKVPRNCTSVTVHACM